jgi:hypothetical protein
LGVVAASIICTGAIIDNIATTIVAWRRIVADNSGFIVIVIVIIICVSAQ